jgi:hypothetical protein
MDQDSKVWQVMGLQFGYVNKFCKKRFYVLEVRDEDHVES